jgi:hypothetical protein
MDFSIFEPLLALREEFLDKAARTGGAHDEATIDLLKRVVQERDRTLMIAAKAKPEDHIKEILRAASAPLPPLPAEHQGPVAAAAARKTAQAAKKAKKTKKTNKAYK